MVSTLESYDRVVATLERYKGATISVPELSQLLGVKTTTLNARFRRQRAEVSTIGRTNYIDYALALKLTEQHKYALLGWPTLHEASRLTSVKDGTIKARCEKGQVEGYVDLTKRLRINPAELQHLAVDRRKDLPLPRSPGRSQDAPDLAGAGRGLALPPRSPRSARTRACAPAAAQSFVLPPPPPAQIEILTSRDYGLPETETATLLAARSGAKKAKPPKSLDYDPDRPFSISDCAVGKAIRYGEYRGTILKLVDDPFSPRIKVRFPEHQHPLMREVFLKVERRKQ